MLAEKANYKVTMMARALEAGRSGFYYWPGRNPDGADPWARLKARIEQIFIESKRRFGARKTRAKLRQGGGEFGDTTIYRVRKCMREMGTRGKAPRAKKQTTIPDEDAPKRPDLIKRDFTSPVPTYKLVGDITYLKTASGFTCLAVVIDLATRMVVGWAIRGNMRTGLVIEAMEMARTRGYIAEGAIFHSDRGSQYTSKDFAEYARRHGIRLSVSRAGSSYDNAAAESFFGHFKNDWYHDEPLSDPETTKFKAIEHIEADYNRYRPHEAVGQRVPAELMDEFFERFNKACDDNEKVIMAA